jgi:lipoprotein NlpI
MRGAAQVYNGEYTAGIADLGYVLGRDTNNVEALRARGYAQRIEGQLFGAMLDLDKAVTLDKTSSYGFLVRGLTKRAQGNLNGALEDFRAAAQTNEELGALWAMLVQVESGKRENAVKELTGYLSQLSIDKATRWPTPIGYFLIGKLTDAQLLAEADKVPNKRQQAAHRCDAAFFIGATKLQSGDIESAKNYFLQSIATGCKTYVSYCEARAELDKLGQGK